MSITSFSIARLPRIEFGAGSFDRLPALIESYGKRILLVTGSGSIDLTPQWLSLMEWLEQKALYWQRIRICNEPSPQNIDSAVSEFRSHDIQVVVGIGGGSVLDSAKAIAGLLPGGNSVMDYLEGVGPELPYRGPALPYIAVPTTAGTGSEATKNAVLSVQGKDGFKKSFRDDTLVPEYALVDPDLLASCPKELIAANGMDALTQLMESYVSTRSNPLTDALAISGLRSCRDGLLDWYRQEGDTRDARASMAYASLLSGITLAQTGLGSVHGLASPLGAFFPIPHGVVCGTLVAAATQVNIDAMRSRDPGNPALEKYATLGTVLHKRKFRNTEDALHGLVQLLLEWTDELQLPKLAHYGVSDADLDHIIANSRGSSMKTNPIVLSDAEIGVILRERI